MVLDNLKSYFESLLYKNITVTICNYADVAKVFTGILIQVDENSIKMVITNMKGRTTPEINFKRRLGPKSLADHIGAIVEIPINQIDSFLHHPY